MSFYAPDAVSEAPALGTSFEGVAAIRASLKTGWRLRGVQGRAAGASRPRQRSGLLRGPPEGPSCWQHRSRSLAESGSTCSYGCSACSRGSRSIPKSTSLELPPSGLPSRGGSDGRRRVHDAVGVTRVRPPPLPRCTAAEVASVCSFQLGSEPHFGATRDDNVPKVSDSAI